MNYNLQQLFSERLDRAISISQKHPFYVRYALALFLSALVIVLKIGLSPILGQQTTYIIVLPAVLLSTWFGGIGPGILATSITGLAAVFFLIPASLGNAANLNSTLLRLAIYIGESILIIYVIHRRNRAFAEMQARTAQQAVVAAIGQYGIEENNLTEFMNKVVHAIAKTLEVDYCKILKLQPDGKTLRYSAGVGWKRGTVAHAVVDAGSGSQAGYTLIANKPVVVTELKKEKRFVGTKILHEHGVSSGISVVIPGHPTPYGILSIHTRKQRQFTKHDVNFMLALSHVLSTTIERRTTRRELELMAHLNSNLVTSLDPRETLSSVMNSLVPHFADLCEVYIKQDHTVELAQIKGKSKVKESICNEISTKFPITPKSKRPFARVLYSGKPLLLSTLPANFMKDYTWDEEHAKLVKKLDLQSILAVPIKIRRKTVGVIGFASFDNKKIFTKRDLLIAEEIAERVAISIDNALLYQEAKSAIQARDEFLSIASHELKTPLTSMLLQLQSVLHSIKNESLASFSIDKTMTMLESTVAQSKRLSKLVNDLLNISLITTGRMELEKEKTDIAEIVREVTGRLGNQAEKAGCTIDLHAEKSVVGNFDRIRMEQVVTNLITNAIKYGEGKPIAITVANSNNQATIEVADNGMGIPKEQQDKIFNRFQRGEVQRSIKGLGVGLYLVNEIVRAHGGKIRVASKPKEGSTFTVQVPLS